MNTDGNKNCTSCVEEKEEKKLEKVFIVEHRMYQDDKVISVNAAVVSSIEKAVVFMVENQDYELGYNWWWAVYPMAVDTEEDYDELYYYNSIVERIYWQHQQPIQSGVDIFFNLKGGGFSFLNDYHFEGKLVDTNNEKLTFENVLLYYKKEKVLELGKNVFHISELHDVYPVTAQ